MKKWAETMMATDRNHDGIIEYGYSGNAHTWNTGERSSGYRRPANWWDTIGFGHDDAYSNALAYRACVLLSRLGAWMKRPDDSQYFASFASKLRSRYFAWFYNPPTGVLGVGGAPTAICTAATSPF